MARRKTSLMEDLMEIAAKLPWWVGVALALVAYAGFHAAAGMEVAVTADAKSIGQSKGRSIVKGLATALQYVVPLALLAGALMSVLARKKREALHCTVAARGDGAALSQMTWQQFEQVVGEYFRRKGFAVLENGGGGADGGVDLWLTRGTDRYAVQCKQWRARQVGVATVRELYGVMAAHKAAGGYVVTSGEFTAEAARFAAGLEIELIDGAALTRMIREQGAAQPAARTAAPAAAPAGPATSAAPACPTCAAPMVLRTARRGGSAGSAFWGCSKFPACRGTRVVQPGT